MDSTDTYKDKNNLANSKILKDSNCDATTFKDQSAFRVSENDDGDISINSDRQSPESKKIRTKSTILSGEE